MQVGYGDIHAATNVERIFSIVTIVVGISVFAYTAGSVSVLLGDMASAGVQWPCPGNACWWMASVWRASAYSCVGTGQRAHAWCRRLTACSLVC